MELREKIAIWRRGLENARDKEQFNLTARDWEEIGDLLELLRPFAEATSRACEAEQPISFVLPIYNILYYDLKKKQGQDRYGHFKTAMQNAISVIEVYYGYTSHALSAATVLDPRANFYFFAKYANMYGHETLEGAEAFVRGELQAYFDQDKDQAEGEGEGDSGEDEEDDMLGDPGPTKAKDEIAQYKKEDKIGRKEDPLNWWRFHGKRYPVLARAARDHLSARCTSASSERVFSGGRQLISEFRRQLLPENIRKVMLLKDWMEVLQN